MRSAKCPCCKRQIATDIEGRLYGHGGGSCKCDSLLCRWSGEIPPVKKTAKEAHHA